MQHTLKCSARGGEMIIRCSFCKLIVGKKEPYDDHNIFNGCCTECFNNQLRNLGFTEEEIADEHRINRKEKENEAN